LTDDELRRELERTSPAWQCWVAAAAESRLQAPSGLPEPEVTPEAGRHHEVQQEVWRRESEAAHVEPV